MKNIRQLVLTAIVLLLCLSGSGQIISKKEAGAIGQLQPLKVSENKRFLVKEDGMPFFYYGGYGLGAIS